MKTKLTSVKKWKGVKKLKAVGRLDVFKKLEWKEDAVFKKSRSFKKASGMVVAHTLNENLSEGSRIALVSALTGKEVAAFKVIKVVFKDCPWGNVHLSLVKAS